MKADLVYLIADENIATDKSTKFQTEIIKKLKRKKIDSKVVYANRLQIFDIIRVVKEIILDHRDDEFYVNVASGSKIHAIACMMACMVFDNRKNIHPFYPQAKEYPAYKDNEQQTYGVEEIYGLPTYQLLTPNKDLIEILKIIKKMKDEFKRKFLQKLQRKEKF